MPDGVRAKDHDLNELQVLCRKRCHLDTLRAAPGHRGGDYSAVARRRGKLQRVPAGFFHTLPVFGAMFLGGTTADGEPKC